MPNKPDKLFAYSQRYQLHAAAQAGDVEKVRDLIARKYPLNRFDEIDRTSLHYAVDKEHFTIVDILLRAGADVSARANSPQRIGDTALARFIETMSYAMAERLTTAGADPLIRGWMNLNAIDRAVKRRDQEGEKIRRLLVQAAHDTK